MLKLYTLGIMRPLYKIFKKPFNRLKIKRYFSLRILTIFFLFLSGFLGVFNNILNIKDIYPAKVHASEGTATYNSSSSWTAQSTSVTVDVWGGGGGGSAGQASAGGTGANAVEK